MSCSVPSLVCFVSIVETTWRKIFFRISHSYHNRFMALFPGPPGWADARRELLDFMLQGKINRGRHTSHLAGRHSIRTKQCPPPSPHFLQAGCSSCRPTNSVKALKAKIPHSSSKVIKKSLFSVMQWLSVSR